MNSFSFYNPTQIVFGAGSLSKLSLHIPKNQPILLMYGGGSIKQNGIYQQVINALNGHQYIEFSGVEPNPTYENLMQAVELCRQNRIGFILAVGGGSVIDGAKFVAASVHYANDPWEILETQGRHIKTVIPFGVVLTLPATGSEINSGSVISRKSSQEKRFFSHRQAFPQFSILDPNVTASLPTKQIANGIVDAYVHVLEQYVVSSNETSPIQDGFAETLLKTLYRVGPLLMKNPEQTALSEEWMWASTLALNGLIGSGVPQDWSTHMIGHELTALFDIDHARTLAIILPGVWQVMFEQKQKKLAQYGRTVLHLEGTEQEVAEHAIALTEQFFHSMGILTRIDDYSEKCYLVWDIPKRFKERNWMLGELQNIDHLKVEEILKLRL